MTRAHYITILWLLLSVVSSDVRAVNIDSLKKQLPQLSDTNFTNQLLLIGRTYMTQEGEVDSLILYGNRAFRHASEIRFSKGKIRGLMFEGNGRSLKGEYDKAFELWQMALKEAEQSGEQSSIADINNNLGYNYQEQENLEEAIHHYLIAAEAYEKIKNYDGMGAAMCNVAAIFGGQDQHEKCLMYLKKCQAIAPKMTDPYSLCLFYNTVARQFTLIYEKDADYLDTALVYCDKGLKLALESELYEMESEFYNIYSQAYFLKGNFPESIRWCDQLMKFRQEISETLLLENFVRLSDCYRELNNIPVAFQYLDSALTVSESATLYNQIILAERGYLINKAAGKFDIALQYLEQMKDAEDSLFTMERNDKINELEQKYNKAANEQTILELNQEKEISTLKIQLLWIGVAAVIVILLILFILYRQKVARTKLEKMLAEQKLNHARMNPHFVFNAVTSIQHFILNNKANEAHEYLTKFSRLMRSVLDDTMRESMPLSDELESLNLYVELERLRFREKFDYRLNIDPAIDQDFTMIPSMLIQPFVENAIKHGLMPKQENCVLSLTIEKHDAMLKVIIEDNGIGRKKAAEIRDIKHKSVGMEITTSRLEMMNQKAKSKLNMEIVDLVNEQGEGIGTRVQFFIPAA